MVEAAVEARVVVAMAAIATVTVDVVVVKAAILRVR